MQRVATAATWASVLLTLVVGAFAILALARQAERYRTLVSDETQTLLRVRDIDHQLAESVYDAQESLRTGDTALADAFVLRHGSLLRALEELRDEAVRSEPSLDVDQAVSALVAHRRDWSEAFEARVWEDPEQARRAVAELRGARLELWGALRRLENQQLARVLGGIETARRETVQMTAVVLGAAALATVAVAALGRTARRALNRLADARERAALEAAAAEREERERAWLQRAIDQLPVGVVVLDVPDGVVRLANETAVRLDRRFRPGTSLRTLPVEQRPLDAATGRPFTVEGWPISRLLDHGERVRTEILLVGEDGEQVVCALTAGPICDDAGNVTYAAMTLQDVTEAHRLSAGQAFLVEVGPLIYGLRDQLAAAQQVAEAAVPRLVDGLVVHLLEGNEVVLAGLSAADPALEPVARALPTRRPIPRPDQDGIAHVWFADRPLVRSRVTERDLEEVARTLGQPDLLRGTRLRSILQVPIRANDRTYGIITAATSTSNRRLDHIDAVLFEGIAHRLALALENARLFAQARNAAREREEVLAIVAHDLRGPLTALTVRVGLLARRRPDDAEVQATADLVVRAAHQMESLVRVLLDAARIEAGSFRVLPERTDLSGVIDAACSVMGTRARESGVRLEVAPTTGLPPVRADAERIQQVLSNLLGNALDHTPAGGAIEIRTAVVDGAVRVSVRDEGVGIPPEQIPHLFERHWQGEHRRSGGLGIGLYIVRGIVEAHGGRVGVTSEPGVGSTFWFELPRADLEPTVSAAPPS